MKPTIQVQYACDACRLKDIKIQVIARDPAESVTDWIGGTARKVWQDHWRRSPNCKATSLTYLKIPYDEGTPVGAPVSPKEVKH